MIEVRSHKRLMRWNRGQATGLGRRQIAKLGEDQEGETVSCKIWLRGNMLSGSAAHALRGQSEGLIRIEGMEFLQTAPKGLGALAGLPAQDFPTSCQRAHNRPPGEPTQKKSLTS